MSDSDDWETDADYENNLTEQQKRFAGRADVLHDLERQRSAGGVTMEGVRANAFAQDARAAAKQFAATEALMHMFFQATKYIASFKKQYY